VNLGTWLFVAFYILAGVGFVALTWILLGKACSEPHRDSDALLASIFLWLVLPGVGVLAIMAGIAVVVYGLRGKRGERSRQG